jgi:hypothetical protein
LWIDQISRKQAERLLKAYLKQREWLILTLKSLELQRKLQKQTYHGKRGRPSQGYVDGRILWKYEQRYARKLVQLNHIINLLEQSLCFSSAEA